MPKATTQFPKRFLWGASTSAHQVEGGNHNQWSVWELEHAKSLAAKASYHLHDLEAWPDIKKAATAPSTYVSGKASGHYARYEEDFDLVQKIGLNAFRFSVEWSRIEPEEGAWNAEAITHYKQYVASLKKRGVEPMVTLFHHTLPVWFATKGGFEKRSNVRYFTRFAEKIVSELGGDVRYIITMNEPELYAYNSYLQGVWPPGVTSRVMCWRVLGNLIYAHNRTARVLHGLNRRYKLSIAKNSPFDYPGDDARLSRASAAVLQYLQDDYVLGRVKRQCDFLGVNYYASNRVYGYRVHNPNEMLSDTGQDMSPGDLEYVLERLHRKYKLPIIVTANGLADAKDERRKWWLGKTMIALQRARAEGVRVEGYFYSNLLDGFEWAYGKWPRFGLVAVDYQTGKRTIRPSALWWASVLRKVRK